MESVSLTADNDNRTSTSLTTSTGSFSQALAISQAVLNKNLKTWFSKNYSNQGTSGQCRASFADAGRGSLDAAFLAPQIALTMTTPTRPYWFIQIAQDTELPSKGKVPSTMKITSTDGKTPDTVIGLGASKGHWTFAFQTSLNTVPTDPSSDEFLQVMTELGSPNPSDYHVQSLVLDTTVLDPKWNMGTYYSPYDAPYWTSALQDVANDLIIGCLKTMFQKPKISLALTWTTPSPMYPYLAAGQNVAPEGVIEGAYNSLLYLEMTQNQPFPTDSILKYSGNFTLPSIPATMCMGSTVFFDSWLIPQLKEFNRAAYVHADATKVTWELFKGLYIALPYYGYSQGTDPETFFSWTRKKGSALEWEWNQQSQVNSGPVANPNNKKVVASTGIRTIVGNSLKISPGTNQATCTGATLTTFSNTLNNGDGKGDQNSSALFYNQWSFTIVLNSIDSGKLQINLNLPKSDDDLYKIISDKSNWKNNTTLLPNLDQDMRTYIANAKFRDAAAAVQTQLNKTGTAFVFPGDDTFQYSSAMFNNEGDVLVQATTIR